MNYFISSLLFLLLLVQPLAAQKFSGGFKGGIAVGSPIGPAEEGAKGWLGLGPDAGVFGTWHIHRLVELQLDVLYSLKGSRFYTPISGDTIWPTEIGDNIFYLPAQYSGFVNGKFANQYIEVPLMVVFNPGKHFNIHFGGYAAYLIKGKNKGLAELEIGDNFTQVEEEFDQSEFLADLDYGVVLGSQYETRYGLFAGLTGTMGLRSVYQKSYNQVSDVIRNVYVKVYLGFRFGGHPRFRLDEGNPKLSSL